MLLLLSPSKTQKINKKTFTSGTRPIFSEETQFIISLLKQFSVAKLGELMKMSEKLAILNHERFQNFPQNRDSNRCQPALFVFQGDVYETIETSDYKKEDLDFAQNHMGILSGLYGFLRPLDLMFPYRLEMGLKINIGSHPNLYAFWKEKITAEINNRLPHSELLVNLCSNEYFKVIDKKQLDKSIRIITPIFKEKKEDTYRIVPIYAKRARGSMADFIIKNRIATVDKLMNFNRDNYRYSNEQSTETQLVFIR